MSYGQYGRITRTDKDWMGIVALVMAFVAPVVGVVLAHMAVAACERGEASNEGLSKAALVLNWVFVGISVAAFSVMMVLMFAASGL